MNPALPKEWYYVYLLASGKTSWIYIGCTNDLKNRLKEHSEGKVYRSKDHAYKREKNLKAYGSGLAKLKSRLGIETKGRAG